MTSDKSKFDDYKIINSSFIIVTDNNKYNIKGVEDLKLLDLNIKIENVRHVLNLGFNLILMGYLRHQGFKIIYNYKNDYFAVKTLNSKPTFKARCGSNFIYQIQSIIACTVIPNFSD